jgi:glycosyltransferase involved in cell wall biosynthesis
VPTGSINGVAIVHYHLRRGGVTRVIETQSAALARLGIPHVILSGTPQEGDTSLPVQVVPDVDYRVEPGDTTGAALAGALRARAVEALGHEPAIWHIHNSTLGKNDLFPGWIRNLVQEDSHLLLQFHDFAEDGRPGNYSVIAGEERIYPHSPAIHSAFINSRDRDLLVGAGLPADRVHLLPNAIMVPEIPPPPAKSDSLRTILYPVRGIRRKNLGELCLMAGLAPAETRFVLTLAPENPDWRPVYEDWVGFATRHELPVEFDAVGKTPPVPGSEPSFENWIAHASHFVTTSIAEGFGLAFLEPIAFRKPLFGRDLPDITADFKDNGLTLGTLYEDFLIPLDWIDLRELKVLLRRALQEAYDAYRQSFLEEHLDQAWDALLLGDYADFGNLPEAVQRDVAARAFEEPDEVMIGVDGECEPAVDWLESALNEPPEASGPDDLEHYSLAAYTAQLTRIYQTIGSKRPGPVEWLDPAHVLEQFLEPERFHFLRT